MYAYGTKEDTVSSGYFALSGRVAQFINSCPEETMDDSADISDESSLEHRREEDNVRLNESMQEESYSCSRCCHFPCSPQQLLSCRRILAIMSFVGFSCAYALRVNLSVALVAMLNDTEGENNTWVRIE